MNLPNQSKLPLVMLVEAGLAPYECHSYFLPMLRSSCVILLSILLLRIGKREGSCSGLGQGLLRPGLISSVLIMFLQVIYVHPRAVSVLTRVKQAGLVTRRDSFFLTEYCLLDKCTEEGRRTEVLPRDILHSNYYFFCFPKLILWTKKELDSLTTSINNMGRKTENSFSNALKGDPAPCS